MFELKKCILEGCYEILPRVFQDQRGNFVKTFQSKIFTEYGLRTDFCESYYSVSKKKVLRGLHFQTPPAQQAKVVYCIKGEVLDAVVDLRSNSPTFGEFALYRINEVKKNMLYIPEGLAHGFSVQSDEAVMMYNVTSVYSAKNDSGIRWDSVGIPWENEQPIMSERDRDFLPLGVFKSPF